jgi:hypothetical protein
VTWGTAGDSKGASNSHGDLVKETCKWVTTPNTSAEPSLSSKGKRVFFWPISDFLEHSISELKSNSVEEFPLALLLLTP